MPIAERSSGRRRLWFACAGLAAAALIASAIRLRPASPPPLLGPSTTTIVPGVHLLAGLGPSAAYAVETPDGLLLFDTGLEADAAPLKAELAKLGLDWKRIVAIFLTHAHGDHTGGAEHLQASTGARVYAGAGDVEILRAGGPREAFFTTFPMPDHSPHPSRVDQSLKGGERFAFGDTVVLPMAMPGHTPGSICYLVERFGMRILITGDVIMQLGGEKTVGTYSAYLAPRYRGDSRTFLASIQTLRKMPVPDLVLPGHPFTDVTPQSPRLSQLRWEAMLDDAIRELTSLLARFKADGHDFLDGLPAMLLPNLAYLGNREGQAVYVVIIASKPVLVNAPGGLGLSDFVRTGMIGLGHPQSAVSAVFLTSAESQPTPGLKELLETSPCPVIVGRDGVETLKAALGPNVELIAAEALGKTNAFGAKAIPLRGRGLVPVAYAWTLNGKSVLATPRIPSWHDIDSVASLAADLEKKQGAAVEFLASIRILAQAKPDVWIPLAPSEGQNANLYDDQWAEIIANNFRAGYRILQRSR